MNNVAARLDHPLTTIAEAQRDMRRGYFWGAPGMFASAAVWLAAGLAAVFAAPTNAVWTLLVGGVFIHPVGVLLARILGRPGNHSRGNPLGSLALESTVLLVLSLPLALVVSMYRMEWFFPAMLLVIGGRYLLFATLFGTRLYWACGAALAAAGFLLGRSGADPALGAFTGAAIEAAFAMIIVAAARREDRTVAPTQSL